MAISPNNPQSDQTGKPIPEPPIPDVDTDAGANENNLEELEEEEDLEDDEDAGDDEDEPISEQSRMQNERSRMETLFRRLSTEKVPARVHDVLIKGNTKTKDSLLEAEVEALRKVVTFQDLIQAAAIVKARLQRLEIFEAANIKLEPGPLELPGTVNVVVEVVEAKSPFTGDIGIYTKPEARSWNVEGSLKLKNLLGYADLWDGSLSYGWDQTSEVSAGVSLPRFRGLSTPVMARVSLLSQDWLKFSSYKERALGLSLGLLSTRNHDLAYSLSWRTLTDPSQMSSSSVRRQLGHNLLSALKYTFKIDRRNSPVRPTHGFAFVSTSQICGLVPDYHSLRFFRQEVDLRYAFPLGFCNAALNFGISGGLIIPWGGGFLDTPSYLPERFFLGGNSSPVCTLGRPSSLLGFKTRGLGPAEPRRLVRSNSNNETSATYSSMDFVGGDLAVTAFADLSFDLPLRNLRAAGIHGHVFACSGSLTKLTEKAYRDFSFQKFRDSFRSSVGYGIVLPLKLFRMEINYCFILKQHEHDLAKTGVQFSFSSPN